MVKKIFCLTVLCVFLSNLQNYGQDFQKPQPQLKIKIQADDIILKAKNIDKIPKTLDIIEYIKGQPVKDAFLIGMKSYHFNDDESLNETNNLIGFQYKGFSAGTFSNSYGKRSYYVGVGRKLCSKTISDDFNIDFQYKAGILHGYGDEFPNISGYTPFVLPIIGVNYKLTGIDFLIIPKDRPVICGNFRINLPDHKKNLK